MTTNDQLILVMSKMQKSLRSLSKEVGNLHMRLSASGIHLLWLLSSTKHKGGRIKYCNNDISLLWRGENFSAVRTELSFHGRSFKGVLLFASRGRGAALTLRRNGSCGTCGGVRPNRGMRRGSGSGDVEGRRHAGNAYACKRVEFRHDLGTLLSTRGVILRLSISAQTHN